MSQNVIPRTTTISIFNSNISSIMMENCEVSPRNELLKKHSVGILFDYLPFEFIRGRIVVEIFEITVAREERAPPRGSLAREGGGWMLQCPRKYRGNNAISKESNETKRKYIAYARPRPSPLLTTNIFFNPSISLFCFLFYFDSRK